MNFGCVGIWVGDKFCCTLCEFTLRSFVVANLRESSSCNIGAQGYRQPTATTGEIATSIKAIRSKTVSSAKHIND